MPAILEIAHQPRCPSYPIEPTSTEEVNQVAHIGTYALPRRGWARWVRTLIHAASSTAVSSHRAA